MNKSKLKSYAPQARNDFIAMVTSRANQLGISESAGQLQVEPCTVQGDVALIGGQAYPAKVAQLRQRLLVRIKQHGFGETMEAVAYTWFNRFAALRYMELNDYLGHGQRVLSSVNPDSLPDILTHALELVEGGDLSGISRDDVAELKLTGKDGELYKRLLVAQCNKLASAMPFLFERIDDETELLLPDNLLRTDSVVRKLVDSIDEADWDQVEIIGWLYQFYISEKKDAVIGKVVKSEDIPAATQLFTPNWIVKYLVQNSVGRLWLQANPQSTLASQWEYYIQPAEQTPEVQAQLDALIQSRIAEDGASLNPESITVLDPACGSGHILVEAYDLLKSIYLERGYREREIPRLILQKNLFGLDIDDRAAQLAGFALLMKARADDRRLFDDTPPLNVMALQDSNGLDDATMADVVMQAAIRAEGGGAFPSGQLFGGGQLETQHSSSLTALDLRELIKPFANSKTFGSLISIPANLTPKLPKLAGLLQQVLAQGDDLAKSYARQIQQDFLLPALTLSGLYDAVVANPPYMGGKGMNAELKEFAKKTFPDSKSDLFAMFIERGFGWCKSSGFNSMVTMQSWMFLSSYEAMRDKLLAERTLSNMVHMGNGVMGIAFGTAATVFWGKHVSDYEGGFSYCENDDLNELGIPKFFPVQNERLKTAKPDDFKKIPGSPIAYWSGQGVLDAFENLPKVSEKFDVRTGMQTGDNSRFVRLWPEVNFFEINEPAGSYPVEPQKWFLYSKGGEYRKWYGNVEHVVYWGNDGQDIKNCYVDGSLRSRVREMSNYFLPAASWSFISSSHFGCRFKEAGIFFDVAGSCALQRERPIEEVLAFFCSNVASNFLKTLNPTLNFQIQDISNLPLTSNTRSTAIAVEAIEIAKNDWDDSESSFGFSSLNLLRFKCNDLLQGSFERWSEVNASKLNLLKSLEEENNRIFIKAYGLEGELTPEVPESQITLARADREKDCQRLISYAIGCMMGRYSLDEPGLIYAHAGNLGFEPGRYTTFPADADGIVPITDELWFSDDAPSRIREFLRAVWRADTLEENMAWLAESLGTKASEPPDETIRRYIADKFFKDHLQTYKKRPIYWLFSSGKQGAFQALVYLHRYHEGTLARLRAEYVVPLTGKMAERIKLLEDDVLKASTPAARKKIDKDIEKLKKKLDELRTYDEKLRHYADMRISLDLDDGVKVNYGKFGDLLAEVKSVTGGSGDD